jgi:hypothetical protein
VAEGKPRRPALFDVFATIVGPSHGQKSMIPPVSGDAIIAIRGTVIAYDD